MEAIVMESLRAGGTGTQATVLCEGKIPGATPVSHQISAGDSVVFEPGRVYHILTLMSGSVSFVCGDDVQVFDERVTYVPALDAKLEVRAETDALLLEIQWEMEPSDDALIAEYAVEFPMVVPYAQAMQYRDKNKSDKTISRVMIEQRNIPRFCMGSVESYGPDTVLSHAHPMLDQFFASFEENEMYCMIEGKPWLMKGDEIFHIPLGSDHGVEVEEGKRMHYMWIDFLIGEEGMRRLDSSHIPTGLTRSFDEQGNTELDTRKDWTKGVEGDKK